MDPSRDAAIYERIKAVKKEVGARGKLKKNDVLNGRVFGTKMIIEDYLND